MDKANQEPAPQMREVDGKKEYLDEESGAWVSKNELKKRKTQRRKTIEGIEKAELKKLETMKKEAEKPLEKRKTIFSRDDELDANQYPEMRRNFIQSQKDEGANPYPHKFHRDFTIPSFREKFDVKKIKDGEFLD